MPKFLLINFLWNIYPSLCGVLKVGEGEEHLVVCDHNFFEYVYSRGGVPLVMSCIVMSCNVMSCPPPLCGTFGQMAAGACL